MSKKDVYIFGASNGGIEAYKKIIKHYNVKGFLDNDLKKWGDTLHDITIYNPNMLNEEEKPIVYIASVYYKEISEQLKKMGILDYRIPVFNLIEDEELNLRMNKAIRNLYYKLMQVDIESLNMSDYSKRYLKDYINNLYSALIRCGEIVSYVISRLHMKQKSDFEDKIFLDYGGGIGLLSLLAIEFGFKSVYYNDIYDVSVNDVKVLSLKLGYSIKECILGDLQEVILYSNKNNIKFDIIVSCDVLEHIYNLEEYFGEISKVCGLDFSIFMVTGANPYNDDEVKKYQITHNNLEYMDRQDEYGHKKRDSLKAYSKIRKEIIEDVLLRKKYKMQEIILNEFVENTKGLIKKDIEIAINNYFEEGLMPILKEKKFPTNTCDPFTGNWGEHLIDFDELIKFLEAKNFSVNLVPELDELEISESIGLFLKKR
jgi:2-polyprenyl-3-methyl-5-hydroxy-6-metoxy-1,4-benzoquinol methylase